MSQERTRLNLGIPKGSLEKSTVELFSQAGWDISIRSRNYFPTVDDPMLNCKLVRSQEMALYVADGTLDLGLTGYDWIIEHDCQDKVVEICDLEYSKTSNQPCRWVLVVDGKSPIKTIKDLEGKKVATELVNFTKRHFAKEGVNCDVEFSWGATEAKVVEGLVDAVVEITETGSTIKAHGLRIIDDLLYTHTRLIANPKALEDPAKKAKIDQISLLLQAALVARHQVLLKMNIPGGMLEKIINTLPSISSPTVNELHQKNWFAIETVVNRSEVRELIPKLKEAGAQGILEVDLKKVV